MSPSFATLLFAAFERESKRAGYMARGRQIVDATLVSAPKQRNAQDEKAAIRAGKSATGIWPERPAKAAQKDTDACWTVKRGGRKPPTGTQQRVAAIAIPVFGYKNRIVIDRTYGFIHAGRRPAHPATCKFSEVATRRSRTGTASTSPSPLTTVAIRRTDLRLVAEY